MLGSDAKTETPEPTFKRIDTGVSENWFWLFLLRPLIMVKMMRCSITGVGCPIFDPSGTAPGEYPRASADLALTLAHLCDSCRSALASETWESTGHHPCSNAKAVPTTSCFKVLFITSVKHCDVYTRCTYIHMTYVYIYIYSVYIQCVYIYIYNVYNILIYTYILLL